MWDLDRVLFDTDRLLRDNEKAFARRRIDPQFFTVARAVLGKRGTTLFTIQRLEKALRAVAPHIPRNTYRRIVHENLVRHNYLYPEVDRIFHRLRKRGFLHILLSFGYPSFQYKKINLGCSASFRRHFTKMMVTTGPKHTILKKIAAQYASLSIFFVDDTKEHITYAQKYIPRIHTFHFRSRHSLRDVEKKILSVVRRHGKT